MDTVTAINKSRFPVVLTSSDGDSVQLQPKARRIVESRFAFQAHTFVEFRDSEGKRFIPNSPKKEVSTSVDSEVKSESKSTRRSNLKVED